MKETEFIITFQQVLNEVQLGCLKKSLKKK